MTKRKLLDCGYTNPDESNQNTVKDQWVKSLDKLPPEKVEVLCWNGWRMVQKSWMQFTDQDAEWFVHRFTHWMPLPQPPQNNNFKAMKK